MIKPIQNKIIPIFPRNQVSRLLKKNYNKNSNLLYYYFKDSKTGEVKLRVPRFYIVYETPHNYLIDSTIDLRKTKLTKKDEKSFYLLLMRMRMVVENKVVCNDYSFIVKYLASCQFYEFPLMNKVIVCRKDTGLINITV